MTEFQCRRPCQTLDDQLGTTLTIPSLPQISHCSCCPFALLQQTQMKRILFPMPLPIPIPPFLKLHFQPPHYYYFHFSRSILFFSFPVFSEISFSLSPNISYPPSKGPWGRPGSRSWPQRRGSNRGPRSRPTCQRCSSGKTCRSTPPDLLRRPPRTGVAFPWAQLLKIYFHPSDFLISLISCKSWNTIYTLHLAVSLSISIHTHCFYYYISQSLSLYTSFGRVLMRHTYQQWSFSNFHAFIFWLLVFPKGHICPFRKNWKRKNIYVHFNHC